MEFRIGVNLGDVIVEGVESNGASQAITTKSDRDVHKELRRFGSPYLAAHWMGQGKPKMKFVFVVRWRQIDHFALSDTRRSPSRQT